MLALKSTHKVVTAYYEGLDKLAQHGLDTEGAVSPLFAAILRHCAGQFGWTLAEQFSINVPPSRNIRVDGALLDSFRLRRGVWEAKDSNDDLRKEVKRKFEAGYPKDNILFQAPKRAILWQSGREVLDEDISKPECLVEAVRAFFEYQPPEFERWREAVEEFKQKVPELAEGALKLIEQERVKNPKFTQAFDDFMKLCRESVNPNLSVQAVEEMLIQHLLTERIFRRVFNNPDFARRNVIAKEIEKVINALTSQSFTRDNFLNPISRFYGAIETTAAAIDDFSQKQDFLNTVYEKFFQGFSVKVADTHGIVYTPQPIVSFMVKSVEDILQKEFGRSLSDEGVHILDPFVGTGNFIVHVMREIKRSKLEQKYREELHCNEVMLLPYYIASMNIEHEYHELMKNYQPFEGICLVDTFELAEKPQGVLAFMTKENTERVNRQRKTPIFVIIGNPPYNAGQVNENDNNKNRKYETIDGRVRDTYAKDSKATLVNKLSDPYVKAIRWASDRIGDSGVVAFVTNNSFIDSIMFDGMRKHLERDFSKIYHINLRGNARTSGERRRKEAGNVFDDAIRVSVGITFFVRNKAVASETEIYVYSVDDYLKSEDKKDLLDKAVCCRNISFTKAKPDKNHTWLTEGLQSDFEGLLPMGTKETKTSRDATPKAIFKLFSNGVKTNRDDWAYNFDRNLLSENIKRTIEVYSTQALKWIRLLEKPKLDDFVTSDDTKISWSEGLKNCLKRKKVIEFQEGNLRHSLYRPFQKQYLYFDKFLTERRYQMPHIFPTPETEAENRVICVPGAGGRANFWCFISNTIPNLTLTSIDSNQCFPFYTYDEDGGNRRENITDWALAEFRARYNDSGISKRDIFHYVYAVLHHPAYREKYAANLRRELPRIPFAPDFRGFAEAGAKLAELHAGYENQPEYPLNWIENNDISWEVEKMKLSKDKTQIVYNDFLTLGGIPQEAFEYRLGNRSAIEWVIDQYQVSTDGRSGITNNPNRPDNPRRIVSLIGKVVAVSVETVKIIKDLGELE